MGKRGGSLFPAITRGGAAVPERVLVRPDSYPHPPVRDFIDDTFFGGAKTERSSFKGHRRSQLENWPTGSSAPTHREPQPPTSRKTAGPRFLQSVEAKLEADLSAAIAAGNGDGAVFEVWQHHFQRFIESFRTYGPLLSRIKAAYDQRSTQDRERLAAAQAKIVTIERFSGEIELAVAEEQQKYAREKEDLQDQLQRAVEEAALRQQKERSLAHAREQLAESTRQLKDARDDYAALHETNRVLSKALDRAEHLQRIRDTQEDGLQQSKFTIEEQLVKLRAEHADLRGKFVDLQESNGRKTAQIDSDAKQSARLHSKVDRLSTQLSQMTTSYNRVRSQYRALRKVCRDSDSLATTMGVDRDSGRPLTARPNWDDVETVLPDLPFDTCLTKTSRSTVDTVDLFVGWLKTMSSDLREAEAALPWQTANERTLEDKALRADAAAQGDKGYTGKWFVCHGTGPNVPKFLRFAGKVRNRMISKRDTEVFIKSFWEARLKAAEGSASSRRRMTSDREEGTESKTDANERKATDDKLKTPKAFLYDFMKSRFGLQATVAEFGYNLVDALNRYADDPDVDMFNRVVILEELCEAAYTDQLQLIAEFLQVCERYDRMEHGGKRKSLISRESFNTALGDYFPHKLEEDMVALKRALTYDQPLAEISYDVLFEENRDGDQGRFAETLRDQHMYELMQTYPSIEASIREQVKVDLLSEEGRLKYTNMPKDDAGFPLGTTISVVRQALQTFDKAMPAAEQNRLLAIGALGGVGAEDGLSTPRTGEACDPSPVSEYRQITTTQFMRNLRTTVIHRYSRPLVGELPQQSSRQLSFEEHAKISTIFDEIDLDMTGTLVRQELNNLIAQVYEHRLNDQQMDALMSTIDKDGDDAVSLEELIVGITTSSQLQQLGDIFIWRQHFEKFDIDSSGFIDSEEVLPLVLSLAAESLPAEVENRLQHIGDGQLSWQEFCDLMVELSTTFRGKLILHHGVGTVNAQK